MAFNYQKYLKNNVLLNEDIQDEATKYNKMTEDEKREYLSQFIKDSDEVEDLLSREVTYNNLPDEVIANSTLEEKKLDKRPKKKDDIEDDKIPDEQPEETNTEETPSSNVTGDVKTIQDALKTAYDAAQKIQNGEILSKQIGNSITYFSKTFILNPNIGKQQNVTEEKTSNVKPMSFKDAKQLVYNAYQEYNTDGEEEDGKYILKARNLGDIYNFLDSVGFDEPNEEILDAIVSKK